MSITPQQVDYVAHLSRLELGEGEKRRFARQLGDILEAVEKLNELDTEDVDPLIHMAPRGSVFREDEVGESLSREDALRNAPRRARGCFKVPPIID